MAKRSLGKYAEHEAKYKYINRECHYSYSADRIYDACIWVYESRTSAVLKKELTMKVDERSFQADRNLIAFQLDVMMEDIAEIKQILKEK